MGKLNHEIITIAELRARRGKMSQKELADQLGTSQTSVSQWEKDLMTISTPYLFKLCRFFGASADSLLEGYAQQLQQTELQQDQRQ